MAIDLLWMNNITSRQAKLVLAGILITILLDCCSASLENGQCSDGEFSWQVKYDRLSETDKRFTFQRLKSHMIRRHPRHQCEFDHCRAGDTEIILSK